MLFLSNPPLNDRFFIMDALSPRDPLQTLPRLAFGESGAWVSRKHRQAEEKVALRISSLQGYEPIGSADDFGIKLSHIDINGLILTAQASSPTTLRVGASHDLHLVIPLVGGSDTTAADRRYVWRAGKDAALFAAEASFTGISERKSTLSAKLDPERCSQILHSLSPDNKRFNASEIFQTRLLALRHEKLDFTFLFRQLATLLDSILPNRQAARVLGLDDIFYRHVALMMAPEIVLADYQPEKKSLSSVRGSIDQVCDAIRDLSNDPLTLTEMERRSGLSARSLQYAFRKRFGCSPMAWQRRERLYLANILLTSLDTNYGITSICYQTGFSTPSKFAEYYRRQFGETPGETLRRSRGKTP
jgi:AraC-like DNA-binding protein